MSKSVKGFGDGWGWIGRDIRKERERPTSATTLLYSPHPPLPRPTDLTMSWPCKKKHHHRDLATPRSTTNRPPLHIERNREWETERQSRREGERIKGERESLKEERGQKNTKNKEREKVRLNKKLLFNFIIVLQFDSTFRIAL